MGSQTTVTPIGISLTLFLRDPLLISNVYAALVSSYLTRGKISSHPILFLEKYPACNSLLHARREPT